MTDWLDALRAGAHALGITLTDEQEARFAAFLTLLRARNRACNLTAITDPVEIAAKHFLDSLTVELAWTPPPGTRVVDLGTGAGFPGIPLAIRHPEITVILGDSVRKKVDFLCEAVDALQLKNAAPVWARAEEMGRDPQHRGRYDAAFARAVAHLSVLSEYALPLLKEGGVLICQKGPAGRAEVEESRSALATLGGTVDAVCALTVPGAGERLLITVRKVRPTPKRYPRLPGTAKKHPLHLDSAGPTP